MTADERLRRYAELAVRVGANVQQGQDVVVTCLVEHAEITREIVREAYRAGAKHVVVLYSDLHLRRAAVELGPEEELGWSPPYVLDWVRRWDRENPAVISLTGNPNPDLLADLDPALVGRAEPKELRLALLENVRGRHVNWVIVAAPNEGWARQVFGEPDIERLWAAVATATRLDEPDPVAAWRAHAQRLQSRADALNARGFDALSFRGPGTDLTVGLLPAAHWECATFETASGIEHVPNLPTEEVFTSPDWRRTEGVVRSTYPLVTAGTRVSGLEVRFEQGKIVEVGADSGAEIIRTQLATDEQAPYLGEVALVDGSSPVKQSGLVFCDTLFDENATCHIAFGDGLPETLGRDIPREELLERGVNVAGIHVDFMIGGAEVDVDGLDTEGNATPVIRGDVWQLDST
ncbi:MAG TPA: aminopeptidase [Gaiellaceae bacterium]|nr:aminopeptidase [Gaiellaceae bacterium]